MRNARFWSPWLVVVVLGFLGCKSKEVAKTLLTDEELSWFVRATQLATPPSTGNVFHCNATTPTETCFLPPKERAEMLVNGRVTVSNRGLDFLSACRTLEPLLQAAFKRDPQFVAILSEVAVGLAGPTVPMILAARAEFEATLKTNLVHNLVLPEAIKAAAFRVFPYIAGNLSTLDDAELSTLSGALLNLDRSDYSATLAARFK